MGGSDKIFPEWKPAPQEGLDPGEVINDLAEGEKVPDLFNPSFTHEPGSGLRPVRRRDVCQLIPQGGLRLDAIPREIEIVGWQGG